MEKETLQIENAGLVLLWPFLQPYFDRLNLLLDNSKAFRYAAALNRAIHLTQFLVTGQTETPESTLALNKLMCGSNLSNPVSTGIEITDPEHDLAEELLKAVSAVWQAFDKTSTKRLRETFLMRSGQLVHDTKDLRLTVAPKAFDILLDRLPWQISVVSLPWMTAPLYVKWGDV